MNDQETELLCLAVRQHHMREYCWPQNVHEFTREEKRAALEATRDQFNDEAQPIIDGLLVQLA